MHSVLKLCVICSRVNSRNLNVSSALHGRFSKKRIDPGISNQLDILEEDDPYREQIENEEDLANLETDFANVDRTYGEHKKEQAKKHFYRGLAMTKKRYFAGPKPPNMLTWAERQQIKYLHRKDPEEWSVEVLAESFPATPETITKILRTKWEPQNKNKLIRMDEKVHENWRLLEEGKLEAEPDILAYLKKFIGRREEYLQDIDLDKIERFLKPPVEQKRWNNGQMSSILESYEKQLLRLEEKEADTNSKQITSGTNGSTKIDDGFSKESATGKFSPAITANEFKSEENRKELASRLCDKVYIPRNSIISKLENLAGYVNTGLESQNMAEEVGKSNLEVTHKRTDMTSRNKPEVKPKKAENSSTETERCAVVDKSYEPSYEGEEVKQFSRFGSLGETLENNRLPKTNEVSLKQRKKRPSYEVSREGRDAFDPSSKEAVNDSLPPGAKAETQSRFLRELEISKTETDSEVIRGDDTKQLSMEELGNFLRREEPTPAEKPVKEEKSKFVLDLARDKEQFAEEEKSIDGTFFWPSNTTPNTPAIKANPKQKAVKAAFYDYGYPERIKIPKDKRGSGLTFRVKDCFYDDDGEFLYRVPGINKQQTKDEST